MDKKTFTIGVLSLTAVILFCANLLVPPPARANEVVKDRNYQVLTARIQPNDEALYVLDNRSGQMGVFVYSASARQLQLRSVKPVMDAFAGAGTGRER